MEIPQKYKDMVGTLVKYSGNLFSIKKDLPEKEYKVLKIRIGEAMVCDMKRTYRHPTYELLLHDRETDKVKWSRPFPIREVNFIEAVS